MQKTMLEAVKSQKSEAVDRAAQEYQGMDGKFAAKRKTTLDQIRTHRANITKMVEDNQRQNVQSKVDALSAARGDKDGEINKLAKRNAIWEQRIAPYKLMESRAGGKLSEEHRDMEGTRREIEDLQKARQFCDQSLDKIGIRM